MPKQRQDVQETSSFRVIPCPSAPSNEVFVLPFEAWTSNLVDTPTTLEGI